MTDDRIRAAQHDIQENLKAQPEYVVNTSEFMEVKQRLAVLEGKRRPDKTDTGRPTLRTRSGAATTTAGDDKPDKPDQDERPTLKRRE